jgi:hypothetical protein
VTVHTCLRDDTRCFIVIASIAVAKSLHEHAIFVSAPTLSERLNFTLVAATTAKHGNQFALLDVKSPGGIHHPLVMAAAAQGIAPMFFF